MKNALIIFTRNPELGKCKTRLAATVGDESALNIYTFLVQHTAKISEQVDADKFTYYSEKVRQNDVWNSDTYHKKEQKGDDLGVRMQNAFAEIFEMGYENVIIIGSDMYDLSTENINHAFFLLNQHNFVVGPAKDGGYYLLGMKSLNKKIFKNKTWGTSSVLEATLADLKNEHVALLKEKNDIDYFADIKNIEVFQQFLPAHLDNTFN